MAKTAKTRSSGRKSAAARGNSHQAMLVRNRPLRDLTEEALHRYFRDLNGHHPGDLYELVLGEIEEPLLRTVMEYAQGNQSLAAELLGINRATLRKKLRHYRLLN